MNARQEVFCQEYLIDLNASAAAVRAGFKGQANVVGSQLMSLPQVQARVAELMDLRAARVRITADRVLLELEKIAFGKMSDIARWNESGVSFLPSNEISRDADASIAEVSESTNQHGGQLKIKRFDKVKALELIGRHLGMFKPDQTAQVLNVSGDLTVIQKDVEERLKQVKGEK